jgi:hypothetical protein
MGTKGIGLDFETVSLGGKGSVLGHKGLVISLCRKVILGEDFNNTVFPSA